MRSSRFRCPESPQAIQPGVVPLAAEMVPDALKVHVKEGRPRLDLGGPHIFVVDELNPVWVASRVQTQD